MIYVIGLYILITFLFSIFKKNNTFNSFSKGINDGIRIVLNMFNILLIFSFCITCIENCGIIEYTINKYGDSGFINIFLQMIIRPVSSGSSYAILLNIYNKYGINSFYSYLSTFIHSSCDTLFYIITIYSSYSKVKLNKKPFIYGILTILFSYLIIFLICFMIFK